MAIEQENVWANFGKKGYSDVNQMKIIPDKQAVIRLLPRKKSAKEPIFQYSSHWVEQNTGVRFPIFHDVTKSCPICKFVQQLWADVNELKDNGYTDDSNEVKKKKDFISKISAKAAFDINVIDRKDSEDENGKIIIKRWTIGNAIFIPLKEFGNDPEWGSPTHDENGYDIRVTGTKSSVGLKYNVTGSKTTSPLTDEEIEALNKYGYDLATIRSAEFTSDEKIDQILDGAKIPQLRVLQKKKSNKVEEDENEEDDGTITLARPKPKFRPLLDEEDNDNDDDGYEKPKFSSKKNKHVVTDEDEEEEKPKSKKKPVVTDDDEEEKPKSKKKPVVTDEDDEEEKPKSKKKPVDEEDDEEKPKSKKKPVVTDDEEDEEEKPKSKKKPVAVDQDEEDDEEKPKSKKKPVVTEDEEDEEEKPKSKKKPVAVDQDEEDDEEKPKSKKKPVVTEDEDDEEKPKSKKKPIVDEDEKDEDEEAETPKSKKKSSVEEKSSKKQIEDDEDEDLDITPTPKKKNTESKKTKVDVTEEDDEEVSEEFEDLECKGTYDSQDDICGKCKFIDVCVDLQELVKEAEDLGLDVYDDESIKSKSEIKKMIKAHKSSEEEGTSKKQKKIDF